MAPVEVIWADPVQDDFLVLDWLLCQNVRLFSKLDYIYILNLAPLGFAHCWISKLNIMAWEQETKNY